MPEPQLEGTQTPETKSDPLPLVPELTRELGGAMALLEKVPSYISCCMPAFSGLMFLRVHENPPVTPPLCLQPSAFTQKTHALHSSTELHHLAHS